MSPRPVTNREYTVLSIAILAVILFCVFIVQVFDSPTSVWLVLGVLGIAVVGGVYVSRNPRV